jgi:hypothetical protein
MITGFPDKPKTVSKPAFPEGILGAQALELNTTYEEKSIEFRRFSARADYGKLRLSIVSNSGGSSWQR